MDYMTLFPSASRNMPRFSALAEAILSQVNDLLAVIAALPAAFSVSSAVGEQLDAVGASFMFSRPEGMSDADYRACLLAKLLLYTWDGTNASAQSLMTSMFQGSTICDNCDGTVSVHPASDLQRDQKLYPLPAGIKAVVSDQ